MIHRAPLYDPIFNRLKFIIYLIRIYFFVNIWNNERKKNNLIFVDFKCKIFYIYFRNVTCDECCLEKGEKVWKGFPRVYTRYTDLRKSEDVTLNRSVCGLSFKADLLFYNVCIRTKCPLLDIVSPIEGLNRGRKWEGMERGGRKKKMALYYSKILADREREYRTSGKGGWQWNICIHFNWLFSCSLLAEYFTFENAWRVMDGEISIIKHGNTSVFVPTLSLLFPFDKTIRFYSTIIISLKLFLFFFINRLF